MQGLRSFNLEILWHLWSDGLWFSRLLNYDLLSETSSMWYGVGRGRGLVSFCWRAQRFYMYPSTRTLAQSCTAVSWLLLPCFSMPSLTWFSSVQSLSRVRLFATPWTAAHQASLSITNSRSSPKLMSMELVMLSNHLIFCRPLLLPPSIFPSIRVFSNESALRMRWPSNGVSASTSVLPVNTQDWAPLGWTGWISLRSKGPDYKLLEPALRNSGKGTQKDICPQEPLGSCSPSGCLFFHWFCVGAVCWSAEAGASRSHMCKFKS